MTISHLSVSSNTSPKRQRGMSFLHLSVEKNPSLALRVGVAPFRAMDRLGSQFAIFLIRLYQIYLSPHKGFRCAHGVLHRGDSCSEAIRKIIMQNGFWRSGTLVFERFRECKQAAQILKSSANDSNHGDSDTEEPQDESSSASKQQAVDPCACCNTGIDVPVSCVDVSFAGDACSGGVDGCSCTPF